MYILLENIHFTTGFSHQWKYTWCGIQSGGNFTSAMEMPEGKNKC